MMLESLFESDHKFPKESAWLFPFNENGDPNALKYKIEPDSPILDIVKLCDSI